VNWCGGWDSRTSLPASFTSCHSDAALDQKGLCQHYNTVTRGVLTTESRTILKGLIVVLLVAAVWPITAVPLSQASSSVLGEIKVFIVTIEYPDHRHGPATVDPLHVFEHVDSYVREVSLGKAYVTYQKTPSWLMMPHNWTYYMEACPDTKGLTDDVIRAADPYVDYRLYDSIFIWSAGGLPSDPHFGQGPIYERTRQFSTAEGTLQLKVAAGTESVHSESGARRTSLASFSIHEFMHTLGLSDLTGPGDCRTSLAAPYLGRWSMMSLGYGMGCAGGEDFGYMDTASHLDAWSKINMGWIGESEILEINPSSLTALMEIDLSVVELQGGRVYAVKIPKTHTAYYLVEARSRVGYDSTLPSEGVLITIYDDSIAPPVTLIDANPNTDTSSDAAFQVGQNWSSETFEVAIVGKTCDSYRLLIGPRTSTAWATVRAQTTSVVCSQTQTTSQTETATTSATATHVATMETTSAWTTQARSSESFSQTDGLFFEMIQQNALVMISIVAVLIILLAALLLRRPKAVHPPPGPAPVAVNKKYCSRCGAQIDAVEKFCSKCGGKQ